MKSLFRLSFTARASSRRQRNTYSISRRKMSTCQTELGPGRFLDIPNHGKIHVREIGPADATPIVFIPAAPLNGDFWRKVVPGLSDKYRCICPDIPNGGQAVPLDDNADLSPTGVADLIKSIIDNTTQADKRPIIVGNDSGGALTQIMISRHPDAVSKVILTNCDTLENFVPAMFMPLVFSARYTPSILAWSLRKAIQSPTIVNSIALLGYFVKNGMPWSVWENFARGLREDPKIMEQFVRFAAGIDNSTTIAAAKTFHKFDKPVLLAWASEAPVFEAKWATKLNSLFPNSEIDWIKDSYGFIPEDNPQALIQSMRRFLEK